jgi:hypothetical protein
VAGTSALLCTQLRHGTGEDVENHQFFRGEESGEPTLGTPERVARSGLAEAPIGPRARRLNALQRRIKDPYQINIKVFSKDKN